MTAVLRCPRCQSTDVECQPARRGQPHHHLCHTCGYDGTTPIEPPSCGKRYGNHRQHVCTRPAGHTGRHALRPTVTELGRTLR